ncbi:hypothetical protein JCM10908_006321 [Rhodotorula pacifica]|uniref:uncharacterized protein n=1 Tax=Rhodotorula pacifica TaxID=1495444 RepID=UPI00316F5B2E
MAVGDQATPVLPWEQLDPTLMRLAHAPVTPAPAAKQPVRSRISFLTLPDELISRSYEHLHALYRLDRPNNGGGAPPTRYLLVCRRMYSIARRIWFSDLSVPEAALSAESYLANLFYAKEVHEHVKTLEVTISDLRPLQAAVVSCLTNLTTLQFRVRESTDVRRVDTLNWHNLPTVALRLFANLPGLTSLVCLDPKILCQPVGVTACSLWASAFRGLRHLDIDLLSFISGPSGHILEDVGVTHLCLRVNVTLAMPSLPWQRLQRFELQLNALYYDELFFSRLAEQTNQGRNASNLTHLALKLTGLFDAETTRSIRQGIYICFERAPLVSLFLSSRTGNDWTFKGLVWPWATMQKLILDGLLAMYKNDEIEAFYELLVCVHRLTHLTLRGFTFVEDHAAPTSGAASIGECTSLRRLRKETDPLVLRLKAPHLFTLVTVLASRSKLVRFEIQDREGITEVGFMDNGVSSAKLASINSSALPAPVPAKRRPSLLILPDETLALVFEYLHAVYQRGGPQCPPLDYLVISKRLYPIVRPIWLSVLSGVRAFERGHILSGRLPDNLRQRPELFPHIRNLRIDFDWDHPERLDLVSRLRNLEVLRIGSLDGYDEIPLDDGLGVCFPPDLCLVLEQLPELRTIVFEDEDVQIAEMPARLPQVEHVELPAIGVTRGVRKFLQRSGVTSLRVRVTDDIDCAESIPWAQLETLNIQYTSSSWRDFENPYPLAFLNGIKRLASYPGSFPDSICRADL